LGVYYDQGRNIDFVILDLIMPDMAGSIVFDHLKAADPEVKILLSSGYSLEGRAADIMSKGCNEFIQKPFRLNELSSKIRAVIAPA
jgi:two-component system cell cycle sensor histidine kinase/response regulator CckA